MTNMRYACYTCFPSSFSTGTILENPSAVTSIILVVKEPEPLRKRSTSRCYLESGTGVGVRFYTNNKKLSGDHKTIRMSYEALINDTLFSHVFNIATDYVVRYLQRQYEDLSVDLVEP